jgi:hypothetical protein
MRSLAAERELALILTPRAARAKEKAAKEKATKKRQAREDQLEIRAMGPHSKVPYLFSLAQDAAIPINEMKVKTIGSIWIWKGWLVEKFSRYRGRLLGLT